MSEKVFFNSDIVDSEKACVSIKDGGFLYGVGLFETMQSRNGIVFALNDHLDRLFFSASALSIRHHYDRKLIADAVQQTLSANNLSDARLRLTLTSGSISGNADQPDPTLVITATKFEGYPAEYYQKGASVILSAFRQNPTDPTTRHKTVNYFSRLLSLEPARKAGAIDALRFTPENKLAEGCLSNVFIVKDSVLYTPPIETPILAGIARKTVCQLALKHSMPLFEQDIFIPNLLEADELFITNVIMQVMPVVLIDKNQVGDGKPGPITKKLAELFEWELNRQCGSESRSTTGSGKQE